MGKNTNVNKQQRAISQLKDLYSKAKNCKMTGDDITKEYIEILNTTLAKCPQIYREYVRGYQHALYDSLWQYMEFCYKVNGVWYTTSRDKDATKARWNTLPDFNMQGKECCHMWFNTERPYTAISVI